MKSYTDIEQSRKLAEILPFETADMYYPNRIGVDNYPLPVEWKKSLPLLSQEIPCWSLSALLDAIHIGDFVTLYYEYNSWHLKVNTSGNASDNRISYCVIYADSPIDACVEMVLKLHNFDIM